MALLTETLLQTLRNRGVPVVDVSIPNRQNSATWRVRPETLQSAAQPIIDSFDPNDPAFARAEADQEVDTDDRLGDLIDALLTEWPSIYAELGAGTFKKGQAALRMKATLRKLRRARKGV